MAHYIVLNFMENISQFIFSRVVIVTVAMTIIILSKLLRGFRGSMNHLERNPSKEFYFQIV